MAGATSVVETGLGPVASVGGAIRAHIISGDYAPGRRLTEEELASQHAVSRTSVREALRVLASLGFIVVKPYFGTFVAEMTAKEAADLFEVQGTLEPLAAGLAASRRSAAQVADLRAIVAQGRQAARDRRVDDAAALHGKFHAALAAASGNDSLATLILQLRDKIDWLYATRVRRPPGDSWDEHARMVEAIADGDPDRAVAAARSHIQHGADATSEG